MQLVSIKAFDLSLVTVGLFGMYSPWIHYILSATHSQLHFFFPILGDMSTHLSSEMHGHHLESSSLCN